MNFVDCLKEQADGNPWYRKMATLLCFHMSVALMYFLAIYGYYDLSCRIAYPDSPMLYGGYWKYLTYWNILAQFLFFSFSCITDTIKPSNRHLTIFDTMIKFRDAVYAGIVFPYGLFVSCMFWGIYVCDRELIFPESLDGWFPAWLNHISHSVQLPTLCVEAFIVSHRYPSRKVGLATTLGFGGVYLMWIFYLALAKDIWVYQVLEALPWYGRLIFIPSCFVLQLILYIICEKINCIWGLCTLPFDIKSLYRKTV